MGEVKMTHCPSECNVFIHAARRERKRRRIAEMWKYRAMMEEVEDKDVDAHIRGGVTEEGVLLEVNEVLPDTMEEHFIRKMERPASWGNTNLNPQAKDRKEKTVEEMVPEQFHKFIKVFSKKELEWMPVRKAWDHAIDLKPDFVPRKAKNIPLSLQEQKEVEEFLNSQLSKGYIRESKSPQTSAVFFIPKKDMKK